MPRLGQALAPRGRRGLIGVALAAITALFVTACGDGGGVGPGTLRIGQIGKITMNLEIPRRLGAGTLVQRLEWESSGAWTLYESISYRDLTGDETIIGSVGDPAVYLGAYTSLIVAINEVTGLELFIDGPPRDSIPVCASDESQLRFSVEDTPRSEVFTWTQCVSGTITEIRPMGAGPSPGAARLVMATQHARDATLGSDFVSTYEGTVPFGTIAVGESTHANATAPFVIDSEPEWAAFWLDHAGGGPPPTVDFDSEVVIVGIVGDRSEAGEAVEVRRVLEVAGGTLIHVFETVPGDFCSPLPNLHRPYHIVVAPATPAPFMFADVAVELVSCGG